MNGHFDFTVGFGQVGSLTTITYVNRESSDSMFYDKVPSQTSQRGIERSEDLTLVETRER